MRENIFEWKPDFDVPDARVSLEELEVCVFLPDAESALHGGDHQVVGEVVRGELGHPPRQLVLVPPDMYRDT